MSAPERYGTTIIEMARDMMSAAAPVTGTRATGRVLMRAKKEGAILPRNWYMIPIINGAAREELLFKVDKGPNSKEVRNGKVIHKDDEPNTMNWWDVLQQGSQVGIISAIGGKRHNLPAGTKMRLDPPHPDFEDEIVVIGGEGTSGGEDPNWLGGCMSMVMFENMGGSSVTLDAFRSQTGNYPAVIFVWDGSEPADGTTQSSIDRGRTRVGPSTQLFKERFNIFVLSKRMDSDHVRRNEGLKLLDEITGWITDRQEVDGQVFSAPTGVQVRGRTRVSGNNDAFQQVYLYLLQVSVTSTLKRYDSRTFNDWLLSRTIFETAEKVDGEGKVIVDQTIDMRPSDEPDPESPGTFDNTFDKTFK